MAKTIAQIVNGAARRLGIFGEGQTLRSEHYADLTDAYGEVYAMLEGRQIPTWSSTASIPDQYAGPVTDLVAYQRLGEYSPPPNRLAMIAAGKIEAWREIRAIQAKPMMGEAEIQNY